LVNPSSEGLTNDRIHHINYILSRKFADLPEDGQALDDLRLGEGVVEDAIERKGLVLRNKKELDLVAENCLLGSCRNVL
jgi:hypothetical protein